MDIVKDTYSIGRRKKDEPIRNPFLNGMRHIETNEHFKAMSCLFTLLLRLQQAAVHMALTKDVNLFLLCLLYVLFLGNGLGRLS